MKRRWRGRIAAAALSGCLLWASACSDGKAVLPEAKKAAGYHALADLGESVDGPAEEADPQPDDREFQAPTGDWFAGHGIGVSVSAGAKKPGDQVDASIHVIEPAKARDILTRTIRYKLTERKRDGAYLRTVAESTERLTDLNSYSSFSAQLPEKEGAWYYLTAEILSGEQVEDTALGALEVPVQEVKAELTLDRPAYPGSGDIVVTLRNNGPTTLFYGLDYRLEHRDGDIWNPVPMEENAAVPAIGIELKAGGAWKQKIRVTDLPSGEYRIAKDVEGKGTSIRKTLTAGFRVEPQETAK